MKWLAGLVAVTVISSVLLLSALPSLAIEHKHIETFNTTLYKDLLNTTAWWDTLAGELKLYPFAPTLVGSYDTPGNSYGVAVSGDHAFVADYGSGLLVMDISDPTAPALVGTCDTPGNAMGVAVSGGHAFVADYGSGLQVIDISNPTTPTLVGTYNTSGYANGVDVSGTHVFVADGSYGLQVIDISNPTTPTLAGTYNTPGSAYGVAVSGNHAFVADWSAGVQVIDISDPTNPALVGTYNTPGAAYSVTVSGDHAYVGDFGSGLQVIDISNPAAPTLAGAYDTPGMAYGVTVSGDHAFVADYDAGLQVIDISNPAAPTFVGTYDTPGSARYVTVSGARAFVADGGYGLQVIRVSHPAAPALVGAQYTPGYAYSVAVSGDHAFVTNSWHGLLTMDISDPTSPELVGTYTMPAIPWDVTISGDLAFVANGDFGLKVIDISDPATPTPVGTCDTPDYALAVAVSGDHAFVADAEAGLQVIDIGDPTTPTLVGTYDTPSTATDLAVSGNHVLVADWISGLEVIDVSDPTTPVLVGTYDTPGYAVGVAVSGSRVFVADQVAGLQVIDVSNPTTPVLVGTYGTPGSAANVVVSGDRAFVAGTNFGLQVIDISDPTTPTLVGTCDTPGYAVGVTVSGDHAFVADYEANFQVIQVFQSEIDPDNNIGRSLAVDASNDEILRARVVTTQANAVTWELSADGGVSWQGMTPNGNWNQFTVSGTDLMWRSTHTWAAPGVNPSVTQLEVDWLYEAGSIDLIVDVPEDQGGWVSTHFTRSGLDFADETTLPIASYGIWRRVDSAALVAALHGQASAMAGTEAAGDVPELGSMPVITYEGRTYIQSRPGLADVSFPPGTWERVDTLLAAQQDAYVVSVPTVEDSSGSRANYTVLVITAHTTTPSIWYVSHPDSGYSLDNIAPAVPTGFVVAYNTGSGNELTWDECEDKDFQHFRVYRSNRPDFIPSPSLLVEKTAGTRWTDPDYDGWDVYYKITAVDHVGNESGPASPEEVTAVTEPVVPQTWGLHPNVPNPFNPTTTIRYDVPASGGTVTLRIYDVSGRVVRTLVDEPQTAGEKTVTWNGRDTQGRSAASGVYFYRLQAPGYEKTLKMTLVQ